MFVNNAATRRGKRAATVGRLSQVITSNNPIPKDEFLRLSNQYRSAKRKRKVISIGDTDAAGLVIQGPYEYEITEGTDPDSATPPGSGITLENPDFPVSYAGRGTLKFTTPIRISSVDGDLPITGQLRAPSGTYLQGSSEILSWEADINVGETGAGNKFTIDNASSYVTYTRVEDHITIHVTYHWSSKGSVAAGSAITIGGLPYTQEAELMSEIVHCTGVTPIELGSYFFVKGIPGTTELLLYSGNGNTGTETVVTGALCAATGSIEFTMDYHGVIP